MRRVTRIQKESRSGQGYLSHENCESPPWGFAAERGRAVTARVYQIRVRGRISADELMEFEGVSAAVQPTETVLTVLPRQS